MACAAQSEPAAIAPPKGIMCCSLMNSIRSAQKKSFGVAATDGRAGTMLPNQARAFRQMIMSNNNIYYTDFSLSERRAGAGTAASVRRLPPFSATGGCAGGPISESTLAAVMQGSRPRFNSWPRRPGFASVSCSSRSSKENRGSNSRGDPTRRGLQINLPVATMPLNRITTCTGGFPQTFL